MIVRTYHGKLLLIRQTDHMVLAGQLADIWGNKCFARSEPFAPLARAAYEHDTGCARWEAAPKVDRDTRRPYQFTDLPVEEHLAFYREGVDRVAAADAHAGLLVNLHCQGLYNQRFGTTPAMTPRRPPAEQETAVRQFLTALQAQRCELGLRVPIDEPALWTQYMLLQIYDRLSLYLCMPQRAADLGPVPTSAGGAAVTLALRPTGGEEVAVAPWPFRDPVAVV